MHLKAVVSLLDASSFASVGDLKTVLMPYATEHGKGNVLWTLRMALSGQEKSVDPFTICYVLGKEEVCARLLDTCNKLDM